MGIRNFSADYAVGVARTLLTSQKSRARRQKSRWFVRCRRRVAVTTPVAS